MVGGGKRRWTWGGISAIALASGFESPSHFSRSYRALFGRSPKQERVLAPGAARPAKAGG